jgi:hypothetical protein
MTNTQALAVRTDELGVERLGEIMFKSGFFKDVKDASAAIVKVLAGRELGLGPVASMRGVYIIEGRTSLSADLIAACIQKSGKYRYRVRDWTAKVCRIEFFEDSESLGFGEFTIEEAAQASLAGKATWKSYPKAMLFARAMSQGARAYCPEVFAGAIYAPEELGADVDGNGSVIVTDAGHSVNVETGEVVEPYVPTDVREVDDADIVRSADEQAWKSWQRIRKDALEFGVRFEELRLPMPRSDLKAYAEQVIGNIKERKGQLAKEDTERVQTVAV